MFNPNGKPPVEVHELSVFFSAFGKGIAMSGDKDLSAKMERASYWLGKLSYSVCGAGYIGCFGGPNCSADHK